MEHTNHQMEWLEIHEEDDLSNIELSAEQKTFILLADIVAEQKETLTLLLMLSANNDTDKAVNLLDRFNKPSKLAEWLSQWVIYKIAMKIVLAHYAGAFTDELTN